MAAVATGPGPLIRELTWAEVSRYRCCGGMDPNQREPIPRLADVLTWLRLQPDSAGVGLNIELKLSPLDSAQSPTWERLDELFTAELANHLLPGPLIVQCFDHGFLKLLHRRHPTWMLSALMNRQQHDIGARAVAAGAAVASPHYQGLCADEVQRAHALGVKVIPYTVNGAADWQTMVDIGVD